MTPCNAQHPLDDTARCDRSAGHRGDHRCGEVSWPRANGRGANAARTIRAAEVKSAVLSDLAAGLRPVDVATRHGLSRYRVSQIGREAGAIVPSPPGRNGGLRAGEASALLAELRRDAVRAGLSPQEYLREAREAIAACERIVAE